MTQEHHDPSDHLDEYWDAMWSTLPLPAIVERDDAKQLECAILETVDYYVSRESHAESILEIGGAPGRWLARFCVEHDLVGASLDKSSAGSEATRANMEALGLQVDVHQLDLLGDEALLLPRSDIVFSLGFIEHFSDLTPALRRHVELAAPGGLVIVGVPNLTRVNGWIAERIAPRVARQHCAPAMHLECWGAIESQLGLSVLFKRWIGGLEPGFMAMLVHEEERFLGTQGTPTTAARLTLVLVRVLGRLRAGACRVDPAMRRRFRRCNSRWWSPYQIAVYRVPSGSSAPIRGPMRRDSCKGSLDAPKQAGDPFHSEGDHSCGIRRHRWPARPGVGGRLPSE